jgi:hypothetical protein
MWEDNEVAKGAMTLAFTIGNPCVINGTQRSTMVQVERMQWHLFGHQMTTWIHSIL